MNIWSFMLHYECRKVSLRELEQKSRIVKWIIQNSYFEPFFKRVKSVVRNV